MSKRTREVWHCDVCGWEWLPDISKVPERCPNRECRSRKWNSGGSGGVSLEQARHFESNIAPPLRDEPIGREAMEGLLSDMRLNIAYQDHPIGNKTFISTQPDQLCNSCGGWLVDGKCHSCTKRHIIDQMGVADFGPPEFHPPASGAALLHKFDALERHAVNCKCLICKPPNSTQSKS